LLRVLDIVAITGPFTPLSKKALFRVLRVASREKESSDPKTCDLIKISQLALDLVVSSFLGLVVVFLTKV
jgi:hypothetical protein